MKMSKAERKAYNQGKRDGKQIGYMEGYAKGLHDGNPFNALIDAFASMAKTIDENPELLKLLDQEELIIVGDDEEYTISEGGYKHLPLDHKKRIIDRIRIPNISVCEDVQEHYDYWKDHFNPNPEDCCNLKISNI